MFLVPTECFAHFVLFAIYCLLVRDNDDKTILIYFRRTSQILIHPCVSYLKADAFVLTEI